MGNIQLQAMVRRWWTEVATHKLQQLCKAIPSLILWELWKKRNSRRHGVEVSLTTMIHNIQSNIQWLIEGLNPNMRIKGYTWEELMKALTEYKPRLYHCIVKWELPPIGSQKCNIDGGSKGNLGISFYGFCIRNQNEGYVMLRLGYWGKEPIFMQSLWQS